MSVQQNESSCVAENDGNTLGIDGEEPRLDVPHPLLKPLRRHRGLKLHFCAALILGSPPCPLLGILGLLLLNLALLGQDGYGGG